VAAGADVVGCSPKISSRLVFDQLRLKPYRHFWHWNDGGSLSPKVHYNNNNRRSKQQVTLLVQLWHDKKHIQNQTRWKKGITNTI